MRRRPGIAGLQRDAKAREQYRAAGEEVRRATAAQMQEQLVLFRSKLEEFAMKHKAEIRQDPVFRAQFHAMCANIGVDPLASNKGMWAELLGFGDYYYELGVQILEACYASRPLNGGLMELGALRAAVARRRGASADPVSEDDVSRALKKLRCLGGGIDLVTIGSASYVRSVPGELNLDKNKALELAQGKGWLSQAELCSRAGWNPQRAADCLEGLLKEGLAMVDDGAPDGARLWWFPALGSGSTGGSGSGGGGAAGAPPTAGTSSASRDRRKIKLERAASPAALPVAAHGGDWETPTPSGSRVSRSEQTPEPRAADSSQDLRSGSARRSATPVSRSTTPRPEAGGRNRHGFRGVRQRPWGPYAAEIRDATSGKRRWVGTFNSAAEAARAYDAAALALHGAMTRTNFKYSRATLAQYPAYVPKNDAAAAAALQAVISGTVELPVPDDPLYAEALEAELAAAAAAGGGAAAGGSSGGGAGPHHHEQRRTPRAGSATPPARARTQSPVPVELHGMPISVPPVRTSSMGIGAQAGAAAAALHLKQLLAAAASDAPSGDSPPHSDSHAVSSAVRFQLDAAGGSGSVGEPVRRGGSPGVAAGVPPRSRLGGSRAIGGDDSFGCNGSSDGGAMLGMKAVHDTFDCGQHYSCASGSPSGFHASGFSPQLGRQQPSASETPHSNGLSTAAGHFAAQSAQQPMLPGTAAAASTGAAAEVACEVEGGDEHAGEEPMAEEEEARPAGNADVALAAAGEEEQVRVANTAIDQAPAAAEADTEMAEAGAAAAAASAPAVMEDANAAGAFAHAAASGLQLDTSAREALLRALLQRRQEAAAALAARAAAAAAAQQQQQQAAAALDALQRRNASTIASLKSLAGAVGPRAMASMLPSLTKLPAVQLLLKSIQTAAPTLVATVEAEQRVAEQQRVALVHRTSELQRLLLAQLVATPGITPPPSAAAGLPAAADAAAAAAIPQLPPLPPRRQPGAPATIDGPSAAAVAASAAASERVVADATAAIGRSSDEDASLTAAAAAAGIPALWKAPAPAAVSAAPTVAQPSVARAEPAVPVLLPAGAAAPTLEPLPGSPALAGAPSPVSAPGTPTSPSAASVAAVAAANKTQLLQLLLAQRQQTLQMQQAGQRQLLGLLGQQRAQLAALKGLVASSPKAGAGPTLQDLSLSPVAKRRRLEDAPAAAAAAATAGEAAAKGQGIGAVSSGNLDALAAAAELFG